MTLERTIVKRMKVALKPAGRRHDTVRPARGIITTVAATGSKRRDTACSPRTGTITTIGRRRHAIGPRRTNTITTVCACGKPFHPTTTRQKHCKPQCRKAAYEKSEKAAARRSKYSKSDKGWRVRDRYQKTGATARNNRAYRERLSNYYERFKTMREKHGYENLTVKLIFGNDENQIPEKAAYRMFELLDHKYYWRHKFMWRPDPNGYWKWKFP